MLKTVTDLDRGIVAGKSLQEWMDDAPAGAFAEAVRASGLDPMYGLREPTDPDEEARTFEVTISYSWRGSASKTYTVTARDDDEAQEVAKARFEDDETLECDDVDDWNIDCVDEVHQ